MQCGLSNPHRTTTNLTKNTKSARSGKGSRQMANFDHKCDACKGGVSALHLVYRGDPATLYSPDYPGFDALSSADSSCAIGSADKKRGKGGKGSGRGSDSGDIVIQFLRCDCLTGKGVSTSPTSAPVSTAPTSSPVSAAPTSSPISAIPTNSLSAPPISTEPTAPSNIGDVTIDEGTTEPTSEGRDSNIPIDLTAVPSPLMSESLDTFYHLTPAPSPLMSESLDTFYHLTPAPSPLMSESLDTFEGETGMPTESHQPWRATSAWAWGKRGTGRAAQDKRRGGEERTGLSNAELAKEEGTIIASSPSFAEEDMENSHPPCKAASFSSPALANAKRSKATSAPPSARATSPSPFTDDDKENGVERKRESKRRRTQLQTSDAMALDPLTLNPISSNSSNGTESDFDFDDDDDDPYKLRNNFSHPGDVALRGLGTKWGEPTYSELKSNHIIFNPRSAHRADLSLPFTHNLETTRDARSLIYWRKGKPEKVGHTRDINRRCAAYKADDKLTIVADLDSIPLRVDQKLQHSLRELFKEIDEHPDIPQYYKDLWKVFRGDAMRLGLKTRLVVSLVEIGCQKAWKLPCRAEAFQAVGCKQVDEWLARIDSAVKKIRKFLNKVKKRNGMKPKAASPMMMSSWKPGRQEFHENRDPTKPMSSNITLTEACVGQKNWEDALPFAAKRDPKTQEDTYSIAYTPEEKEDGKKRIEQWIETISKSGEFGLLDTNSTIFGNESALAAFLKGFGYTSQGSYMEGDLTLWVREPKDSNTMASVILACKPFCQAAHYDPKFQRDLSVRIRRNLAAEVARQVCWYVRDLDLAKTKTVTSTTEYPGLVAACACAVLIEGFHLGGEGIRIVNAIVRDIWSPPEHNACLNNGLKKSHTLMRDIPGQDPQDFAPFSRTAKREQKLGDDANQRDGRYRQRVRNRLSWQTTKEERASLFDDIDEIVGSEDHRWREVLSELEKEGPFSILFKKRKAKMQQERAWNDLHRLLVEYEAEHGILQEQGPREVGCQPTGASRKRGEADPAHQETDQEA